MSSHVGWFHYISMEAYRADDQPDRRNLNAWLQAKTGDSPDSWNHYGEGVEVASIVKADTLVSLQ